MAGLRVPLPFFPINWAPTVSQDVMQCVNFLLATAVGGVPLARAMGTPQSLVDAPDSLAGARMQAGIAQAIKAYEKRTSCKAIALSATSAGVLVATVTLGGPS